jgi:hypothetical protein
VINAEGVLIVQTVWATTPDRRYRQRRTDIETVAGEAALLHRLTELVPAIAGSAKYANFADLPMAAAA